MSRIKKFLSILRMFALDFSRDRLAVFFTFAFPIIFLIIFAPFANGSFQKHNIGLMINEGKLGFLKKDLEETGMWKVKIYTSLESMTDDIKRGVLSAGIWVKDEKVELIYKAGDPSKIGMINTLSETTESILEKRINDVKDILKVDKRKIRIGKDNISTSAYILAGTIAISLLSNGMFSVIGLISDTKRKMLKKFRTTPISPLSFMGAMTVVRLIITLISSIIMLMIGRYMLGIEFQIMPFQFVIIALSSTLAMMALGILFIVIFRSAKAAENFATIFMTIVMFFSGVYFPVSFLPEGLRKIANFIPVKYVAQGMRYTLGAERMKVLTFWNLNLWFFVSGVILLWLSSRLFFKPE